MGTGEERVLAKGSCIARCTRVCVNTRAAAVMADGRAVFAVARAPSDIGLCLLWFERESSARCIISCARGRTKSGPGADCGESPESGEGSVVWSCELRYQIPRAGLVIASGG